MRHNPVGWFEIYVEDIDRATKFYEAVLGTKLERLEAPMENLEMMAFPMSMGEPGAAGALCRMDGVKPGGGGTLIYFSTEDCGVEASRIEGAGGEVQMPKTAIGQYGFIAMGIDTEGNLFGLHSSPTES